MDDTILMFLITRFLVATYRITSIILLNINHGKSFTSVMAFWQRTAEQMTVYKKGGEKRSSALHLIRRSCI